MLSIQIYEAGEVNGLRLRLQPRVNCSSRGPDLAALAAAPDAASVPIPLTRKFLYGLGLYLADRGSRVPWLPLGESLVPAGVAIDRALSR